MRARRTLLQYVVPIVLGWALGCDNPASPKPSAGLLPPLTGDITDSAPPTGSSLDPNGYTATLDLLQSQSVPTNGSTTFSGVLLGVHAVQLSGVASNCSLNSSNPQTVTLTGSSASASFSVNCTATTGSLTVTTSTTGSNLDPDGYTVTVDWNAASAQQIAPNNGSVTFSNLSATGHSVALSGFPANCTVTSANPQSVNVPAGGTATVAFTVSCTATATTGTLTIATSTTGQNLPASYTLRATTPSGTSETLTFGATDSQTFSGIATGNYTLQILDLPANCSLVSGTNPRTVTVTTATTGSNLDLDGYTFTVTGGGQTATRAIATNGTSTFNGIPTGSYQVQLTPSSVAANCTVTSANPQTVNVPASGTTVTFTVSCTTGTITIKNLTTGSNLDPDGYAVIVTASDGTQEPATMATNGSVTGELSTGSYQVM